MQFLTKIIKHSSLTDEELHKLIELKMQHWDYELNEQIRWVSENLSNDDYHLMIIDNNNNNLIAYLNMVHLDIIAGDVNLSFLGIGNVAVNKSYKGAGYGLLLMNTSSFFLKANKLNGILLCKVALKEFYQKSGWLLYNGGLFISEKKFEGLIFSTTTIDSALIKTIKSF